jgi:hypothetical protein
MWFQDLFNFDLRSIQLESITRRAREKTGVGKENGTETNQSQTGQEKADR